MSSRPRSSTSSVPDADRVDACRRAPRLGPRILFLSGGTALRGLSRELVRYTHNSIHLITPFDSGGSSAALRRAFAMPSVGDLRNRLLALADQQVEGNAATCRLLAHRLARAEPPAALRGRLRALATGVDPLVAALPESARTAVRGHLGLVADRLPADFDLRDASVGNLVLVGSFLSRGRDLLGALDDVHDLLHVRGRVCPTAQADAHLAARLTNGDRVVGQHLLTGKEAPPLPAAIEDVWLVANAATPAPTDVPACERARELIATADLICYPMGSFHTSVAANLLPAGIGRALRANACPKVYVPNTGEDPEQRGMSVQQCVRTLTRLVRRDAGPGVPVQAILDLVLLDRSPGSYTAPVDRRELGEQGVEVLVDDLVTGEDARHIDDARLARILVSLAGGNVNEP